MKTLTELVQEMFEILDTVETTDEGREFHPTSFHSCRVLDCQKFGEVLKQMREQVKKI